MEDVFYLNPPSTVNDPNPDSTKLFRYFIRSAPDIWPPRTATHQGLYVMDPDCRYLYGQYAAPSNVAARNILAHGWQAWLKKNPNLSQRDVPLNYVPVVGGSYPKAENMKLRLSYRDLPRGDVKRPGNAQFPNPYNIGWYDINKNHLRRLLTGESQEGFKKLALNTLKDSVRGEMHGWKTSDWQAGNLKATMFRNDSTHLSYYLEGSARLERKGTGLSYSPQIFGFAVYNLEKGEFRDFQLLAFGQRTGFGPSNGRDTDLGPAPMAVAVRMHHPGH